MQDLEKMTVAQLEALMVQRYDGNAGEIIHGFKEMGIKGKNYKNALIRYINRVPAYEK